MPQTCGKFVAHSCGKFAANAFFVWKFLFWRTVLAHNVRRKFAAHSCRALSWHTMCAASMQRTVVAHYSGTQCAPQVCSAQLSHTILVCHKITSYSCRALCCSAPLPHLPPPHPPLVYHPHSHIFFYFPTPRGSVRKNVGMVGVLQKIKIWGWGGKKCRGGGLVGVILNIIR